MDNKGKDFLEQVYEIVRQVPYGRVTSYGAIARYLGTTRGA
ncbi:MGMT family protein, partial [Muriicola sp.]